MTKETIGIEALGGPEDPVVEASVEETVWSGSSVINRSGVHQWLLSLKRAVVLALVDVLCLVLSVLVAYSAWAAPVQQQPLAMYARLWPLLGLFLLAYGLAGLYPGFGLGGVEILRRIVLATSYAFLLVAAASFALKTPQLYSRMTFGIAWIVAIAIVPAGRFWLSGLTRRWRWWSDPCVILGTGLLAAQTTQALLSARTLGLKPVAALSRDHLSAPEEIEGIPVLGSLDLVEEIGWGTTNAVMVDEPGKEWSAAELTRLRPAFQSVLWIRRDADLPVEGVRVRNLGGVAGIEYVNQMLLLHNRIVKRAMDIVLGSILSLFSLPLLIGSAILVKISSPGPIFFSQEREGRDGRSIRVWKLRTMYSDAEERLSATLRADPELRQEWHRGFKLGRDPRVVPWTGHFLRRFSLDELPQLWQVLPGTLSLVGPRPFPDYHLDRYDPQVRQLRRQLRPGITGLWQVMARSNSDIMLQQSHDAYYVRNWSLWMDLYVLGRTLGAVLSGNGAT